MTGPSDRRGQQPDRKDRGDQAGQADQAMSDPELLLGQALRAMAGGGRAPLPNPGATAAGSGVHDRRWSRLSTLQILLVAALAGLILGVAAGLLSLL